MNSDGLLIKMGPGEKLLRLRFFCNASLFIFWYPLDAFKSSLVLHTGVIAAVRAQICLPNCHGGGFRSRHNIFFAFLR